MPTAAFPQSCIPVNVEYQQSTEYLSKLNNSSKACEFMAVAPFRITKIKIDNFTIISKALLRNKQMFVTNFLYQFYKPNNQG